ncbi:nanos homolog 3-like [Leguminivora glycinivorella]|uniref:nanos homolog 3-like n=1 Tax=Leguminivora glycinivorella TaxID=1035111 RepID=UPI002010B9F7|nr:nanos homolog 3-like [Leguminivora glycinivorella]
MEVSAAVTYDLCTKINISETYQDIIPYSSEKEPSHSARVGLLKRRKPLDKDALLAVKLDPAVLEAQVTLKKEDENPTHESPALVATKGKDERGYPSYEEVLSLQQAALLGLTPQQLMLLMAFVDTLRRQRQRTQKHMECAFCKNNGSPASWYGSHILRDRRRVRCPVLRALHCHRCGATGDKAHTPKYCPENLFSDSWSCP